MLGVAVPIQWYRLIQVTEQESAPFVSVFRMRDGIEGVGLITHSDTFWKLGCFLVRDWHQVILIKI